MSKTKSLTSIATDLTPENSTDIATATGTSDTAVKSSVKDLVLCSEDYIYRGKLWWVQF